MYKNLAKSMLKYDRKVLIMRKCDENPIVANKLNFLGS